MTQTKKVHIALCDTLADWEIGYLTTGIRNPEFQRDPGQYELCFVSPGGRPVTTMGGLRVEADAAVEDLDPADSAMLVLPGNNIADTPEYAPMIAAAQRFLDAGTPVAAICGATIALAAAGLLDERRHTSNAAMVLAGTGYAGAERYVEAPAVTDGPLITASGIAPVAFTREVFAALGLYEPHILDAWARLYGEGDPAAYFELVGAE